MLGDANHPHRASNLRFIEKLAALDAWPTYPLKENALLRIGVLRSSFPFRFRAFRPSLLRDFV